jgi:hypothetical protein
MAGSNTCEMTMPLSEVIVTSVSTVGRVRVVVRHGFIIVIVNPI